MKIKIRYPIKDTSRQTLQTLALYIEVKLDFFPVVNFSTSYFIQNVGFRLIHRIKKRYLLKSKNQSDMCLDPDAQEVL
jgi:hypothetical protein